ncbi:S9 family peptidase [Sandarakinorhabdus sp. AAP62]|uniref:S9 family peptidase n=1 Tax=Sandarakinorhabdus sp. AAP62 TaxID=1248916 RepID=UPI0002F07FC0|nr:S9 family peptidase [Sandarakinorhabdus sp. AAP62]
MHRLIAAGLLLASTALHAASPVEPADLYRISMTDAVKTSPDGNHVLFTRMQFDIQTDRRTTEWWLAAVGKTSLDKRLLIPAQTGASGAVWAPDGKRIAYVANWLGKPQIWVMDVADGVGKPITSGNIAPRGLAFSPDGRSIAFTGRAEAPAPRIAGMPEAPAGASWAAPARVITDWSYRTNDGGYNKPGADQLYVVASSGGAPTQLTKGDSDQIEGSANWAPDGQSLVYAAAVRPGNDRLAGESDLYRIAASGGAPERLTSIDGSESNPRLSPDGQWLAWTGCPKTTKFYCQPGLWLRRLSGGDPVQLSAALDRPVGAFEWARDGKALHVAYGDVGIVRVAAIPVGGGAAKTIVPAIGGTRLYLPSSGGDWSSNGETHAFTTVEADRPAALGVMRAGKLIGKIDFNEKWRAEKQIGAMERLTWQAPDGLTIEGWLQYPPNFDPTRKYPVALEIHGGPNGDYGPYFSITHQLYAAAGYVVLWSNPRGSTGYGEKFANGITPEYGGEYPGPDHGDLMAGMDEVLKRPWADARNQFIGGGSGGGVLTTFAIGQTDRFNAAAALRPVTDWSIQALTSDLPALTLSNWVVGNPWDNRDLYWRRSTFSLVGKVKTPTILITGEEDYRTPIAQTEAYYQALQVRGIPAMMVRLPGANHGMGRPSQWLQSNLAVINWYNRFKKN